MLAQRYPYSPGTKPRVAPFGSRWNHISKRDPEPQVQKKNPDVRMSDDKPSTFFECLIK